MFKKKFISKKVLIVKVAQNDPLDSSKQKIETLFELNFESAILVIQMENHQRSNVTSPYILGSGLVIIN